MITDPEEDYARGYVPFFATTIYLDSKPLIPRVESEFWIEQAIKEIDAFHNFLNHTGTSLRVLDLFAGSGALGVAVLKHIPHSHVTFGELEKRHLPTIEKNIRENGIDATRAQVVETDVWSHIHGVFDVVLANPPYVSKGRNTANTSTQYEPTEALFAPDDGFFFIKKIIEGLPPHLSPHGVCYIEHEPFHTIRLAESALLHGLTATTYKDQYTVERFSRLSF